MKKKNLGLWKSHLIPSGNDVVPGFFNPELENGMLSFAKRDVVINYDRRAQAEPSQSIAPFSALNLLLQVCKSIVREGLGSWDMTYRMSVIRKG